MTLPLHLWEIKENIRIIAEDLGLDFFETIFEVVDYKRMNEIAAFGGYPTRYPHWRFGMEYEQLSKSYAYGLSKIYEMVINNNPCYAYLLEGNNLVDQKTVISHVYGHCDFFKNNYFFSKTNRKMMDEMANHATRVRRYIDRYGIEKVESFIDVCLSIDNLIDYFSPFIVRSRESDPSTEDDDHDIVVPRLRSKEYMEDFINPPEYIEAQRKKLIEERDRKRTFPEHPQRDVMLFLLENAPLAGWESDILSIIREEAYYFAPQGQTKVMNEGWACVHPDTYVFTDQGMVCMRDLVERGCGEVFDGEKRQRVYDRNIIRNHDSVTVRTRRGLELCGSNNHRVLLEDGETWKRLDELEIGDSIAISGGGDMWPEAMVPLTWSLPPTMTLHDVAEQADVSVWTVLRRRAGRNVRAALAVDEALEEYEALQQVAPARSINRRAVVRVPEVLDERLGAFLGYLVGDGHISRVKRHLGLTSGDESQALHFLKLGQELFDVTASMHKDEGRWRVLLHSETVSDFLVDGLGLTEGPSARDKQIPAEVLRSSEPVVRAFLRALFDSDGYAGRQGVILSTSSDKLAEQVQLLLLNYGILSRKRLQQDGCWHVHVTGRSAQVYAERVGFGLARKQEALDAYLQDHTWFKQERWLDEIVEIEHGQCDVYDISVTETHRYAAGGVINHNSYWHSKIMTEHVLDASEIIDYAEAYASVMATAPGQFNPYKLGIELFRNIEDRWNKGQFGKEWEECEDLAAKESWNRQLGLGREKIFQVRSIYNDVTFIDEFLTEDFAREQKLFTFGYNKKSRQWEIESREFAEIKQKLLFQLTNFGQPTIMVKDGNFGNRAELLLHHRFEGVELKMDYARDVLENISRIWRRPVNLETIVEGKGRLLTYNGSDHSDRPIEYEPV
ncbi:MAG: SpoVR family protein [Myxococcales bacterium]|nr:SpoVR family protein [Myxococcales bacterium]